MVSPDGHKLNCAIRFDFQASNNAAKYETLLAGLKLSMKMQVKRLLISCNSQLVVSQVKGDFAARDKNMAFYLKKVMELLPYFERFELNQIPRIENTHTNTLSKLASSKDLELLRVVPIEHLSRSSISKGNEVMWIKGTPLWK